MVESEKYMTLKIAARNTLCFALVLVQISAFPAVTMVQAQEAVPESSQPAPDSAPASGTTEQQAPPAPVEQQPPAPTVTEEPVVSPSAPAVQTQGTPETTGPSQPTGAARSTYTRNADGTWSNDKYTWDPVTKQTRPNTPQDYSYNPKTGMWDTTEYVYSPEQGKYIPNVRSTPTNPLLASRLAGPGSANPLIAGLPGSYDINNTGPNSTNSINMGSNTVGAFDLFFNGSISNTMYSTAQSGDALVQGNTLGGNALSGDALAMANLLNMLQSSWISSSQIATFISTIDGNVYGDLLIDPNQLPYQIGSNNLDVDVNISNNGAIDNNVNLVAQSGDATVNGNTTGGNATSGDAYAIANIINLINASINSGRSFLGMINITGNFNGDILLPPGVLEALIANTGANSTNTIGGTTNSDVDINTETNRTINNNILATAGSGDALVGSNTSAGSAATGSAATSTNTLNMVGQNMSGKNGLLVFVNVLGHWYGMVVGPAPTTAQITNTGTNSTNTIGPGNSNQSLTVNATENSLINNDISVRTQSGDATVSNNTNAGNATSGDTESAVNLLNIIGGDMNFSDFFGVLFINVFGSWSGNFGSDTANGGFSQSPGQAQGGRGAGSAAPTSNAAAGSSAGNGGVGQVFGFISRAANNQTQAGATAEQGATSTGKTIESSTVFGNTTAPPNSGATSGASTVNASISQMNWWLIAGVIGLIVTIAFLTREYFLTLREERLAESVTD